MKNSYFLIILIVASLALFVFVSPQDWKLEVGNWKLEKPEVLNVPFRLGLDLLGGTHLVYEADRSTADFVWPKADSVEPTAEVDGALSGADWADAMQGVRDVVERRVNFFGVSEPLVQVSGSDRLIVELAGISDVGQAIELIGETPFLEFKEGSPDFNAIVQEQQAGERLE